MFWLLASLLLAAPPATQVFTVDDDGPADFPSIAQAIVSPLVADGDTLLVAAGSYGSFVLDKALHVLPQAGQRYVVYQSLTIQNVVSFSLVGADIWGTLTVTNVPGRAIIDRCVVETTGWSSQYFFYIGNTHFTHCGELVVQHSHFRGSEACADHGFSYWYADHAVEVENSTIVISDCVLLGGNEQGEGCRDPWFGGGPTSGSALVATSGSWIEVADSTLTAGIASYLAGAGLLPAVQVQNSQVNIRGNSSNLLKAYLPMLTIDLDATSMVSVSGVVLDPPTLPAGVLTPVPAEPFLRATGGEAPGTVWTVDLFGPAGAQALLGLSATAALLPLPTVSELLWLHPTGIFFLQALSAAGQEVAVGIPFVLPTDPVLSGLSVTVQAWVYPAGAGPWLTNPIALVLGG